MYSVVVEVKTVVGAWVELVAWVLHSFWRSFGWCSGKGEWGGLRELVQLLC